MRCGSSNLPSSSSKKASPIGLAFLLELLGFDEGCSAAGRLQRRREAPGPQRGFESADDRFLYIAHTGKYPDCLSAPSRKDNANEYCPAARQKKPFPFRFRGLRKRRENCRSAGSFFLFKIGPDSLGTDFVFQYSHCARQTKQEPPCWGGCFFVIGRKAIVFCLTL